MTGVRELKLALATAAGNDSAGRLLLATVANADLQAAFVAMFRVEHLLPEAPSIQLCCRGQ